MGVFSSEDLERLESQGVKLGEQQDEPEDVLEDMFPEDDDDTQPDPVQDKPENPAAPAEFRYGNDAPEELRGKTPAEALALYQNLRSFAQQLYQDTAARGSDRPAPGPAEPEPIITEEELIASDANSINAKLNKLLEAKASPFINDAYQKLSIAAMEAAERNEQTHPYFKRYKGEILQLATRLPVQQTADPATWKLLHDQIVVLHKDEILEEEVQKRLAAMKGEGDEPAEPAAPAARPRTGTPKRELPFSERGNGGGGSKSKQVKLTEAQLQIARGLGVKPEDFARFAPMFEE